MRSGNGLAEETPGLESVLRAAADGAAHRHGPKPRHGGCCKEAGRIAPDDVAGHGIRDIASLAACGAGEVGARQR